MLSNKIEEYLNFLNEFDDDIWFTIKESNGYLEIKPVKKYVIDKLKSPFKFEYFSKQ